MGIVAPTPDWTCGPDLGSSASPASQEAARQFVANLGPTGTITDTVTTCINKVDGSEKVQVTVSDGTNYLVYVNHDHEAVSASYSPGG